MSSVGRLRVGDQVLIKARPKTKLWFSTKGDFATCEVIKTIPSAAPAFRFRSILRKPAIVGTRSCADEGVTWQRMSANGGDTDPTEQLTSQILEAVAQYEREMLKFFEAAGIKISMERLAEFMGRKS